MQISNVSARATQIIDDWCGTKPRPLPSPGPKGPQILDKRSLVGFNPQPEPPKVHVDEFCGTVPKRFPSPNPPLPHRLQG